MSRLGDVKALKHTSTVAEQIIKSQGIASSSYGKAFSKAYVFFAFLLSSYVQNEPQFLFINHLCNVFRMMLRAKTWHKYKKYGSKLLFIDITKNNL
jgi:hypothetical protein